MIARALARANETQTRVLTSVLGVSDSDNEQIEQAYHVLAETDAIASVQRSIQDNFDTAMEWLSRAQITDNGRIALTCLAQQAIAWKH